MAKEMDHTLKEIADELDITPQGVRKIEMTAIKKLQRLLKRPEMKNHVRNLLEDAREMREG